MSEHSEGCVRKKKKVESDQAKKPEKNRKRTKQQVKGRARQMSGQEKREASERNE